MGEVLGVEGSIFDRRQSQLDQVEQSDPENSQKHVQHDEEQRDLGLKRRNKNDVK